MGEQVLAVGEQQERLIEALLTLSRSQRGLDRHEPVDLLAITREALHTVDDESLTIATRLEPAATTGDPRLLERLVANLVTNAARHNTPNGRIEVRTETRAGRALLTVENTGPTIPPNELDRLFQPFQRLESERTNGTSGLGLGLSIVQAVAAAHQATLDARPRPGGGLHVEIGFPSSLMPGIPATDADGTAGDTAECRLRRPSTGPSLPADRAGQREDDRGAARGAVHELMLAGSDHSGRKRG